ncbi:hypothetical protein EZV62_022327 [Acer yangbiense]|uniref:Tyrosine-protein phosphatase domain-containing protein n=1 Tax=Acer yangbiense TaxID=1000413 RepID=A0A5C7H7Y5_9ROSI|nr:hypothetical protein EZV62_022327 [Acer yangbiense]
MAASSAGNHPEPTSFVFSSSADADSPRKMLLTADQHRHCSEALSFFKEKLQNSPNQITTEFAQLQANRIRPSEMARSCTVALDGVNLSKNRYTDILPCHFFTFSSKLVIFIYSKTSFNYLFIYLYFCISVDKNRVVLNQCKDYRPSARGYINASLITTTSLERVSPFIATQGPMPHTYEDFWEMVIQYRCPVIVMLTRLVDNYKVMVKCGDYFQAEDGPRDFGNICIVTKWIQSTDTSLVLRNLEVNYKESEEPPMSVLHIQYPEWPDHGVPQDTIAVREILKIIYRFPPNLGPIVVHCRLSSCPLLQCIGRTGTYCTIQNTIQRILVGDMTALNIANTVSVFRSQRIGMVQTMDQYLFCYKAIIDELEDLISDFNNETNSKGYVLASVDFLKL